MEYMKRLAELEGWKAFFALSLLWIAAIVGTCFVPYFRDGFLDTDGDGIPNNLDPFPLIYLYPSQDLDGNGRYDKHEPDNPEADTDGDGIPNKDDLLPRCNERYMDVPDKT